MLKKTFQILVFVSLLVVLPLIDRLEMLFDATLVLSVIIGASFHYLAPYISPQEIITPDQLDRNSTLGLLIACIALYESALIQYVYFSDHAHGSFFYVGLLMCAAGLKFRSWTTHTLGKYFTATVTMQQDQTFVVDGPYKLAPSYF